ncbi:hypothetical protein JTB14_008145 [Gonioctena quinquepunctata]|nr:hypothetical protein JTB14_008145 [Gonioctena quinquepunctata]
MYRLNKAVSFSATIMKSGKCDSDLWHQRLGHSSSDILSKVFCRIPVSPELNCRVEQSASEEIIKRYIVKKAALADESVEVEELPNEANRSTKFVVTTPINKKEELYDPNFWPLGVAVGIFEFTKHREFLNSQINHLVEPCYKLVVLGRRNIIGLDFHQMIIYPDRGKFFVDILYVKW